MAYDVKIGEFKGRPILQFWAQTPEGEKPKSAPRMAFGMSKLKAVLENLEAVQKFVRSEGKEI